MSIFSGFPGCTRHGTPTSRSSPCDARTRTWNQRRPWREPLIVQNGARRCSENSYGSRPSMWIRQVTSIRASNGSLRPSLSVAS